MRSVAGVVVVDSEEEGVVQGEDLVGEAVEAIVAEGRRETERMVLHMMVTSWQKQGKHCKCARGA